jgi:hypothetical protein
MTLQTKGYNMTTEIQTLDQKFHTLTDKYKLAKTSEMIATIEGLGYKMDRFVALKVRKKERHGFQKHRVIFTSPTLKAIVDGVPQLLLTNSHDGTSSVILQLGFFRTICANGLVVGDNLIQPVRIRHSGENFNERLIEGINFIVAQADKLTQSIDKMKQTKLSDAEIKDFQRQAIQNRLGDDVKLESFSVPVQRTEDQETDLFTVMNVVQEALIRGGARVLVEEDGKRKDKAIRKVRGMVSQTEINTMLWNLAEQRMAA